MKKVLVKDLHIGDRVVKFDRSWLATDFLSHRFTIKDQATLDKILRNGIVYVYTDAPGQEEQVAQEILEGDVSDDAHDKIAEAATKNLIRLEDFQHASAAYEESVSIVSNVLDDVRSGRMFNAGAVKHIAESITHITMRNRSVLLSMTKLRTQDEYTFQHSMNVSVYAASLATHLGMSKTEVEQIANAGLMHDIGKMMVPAEILNKPDKLTDEEYAIMKTHVERGHDFMAKQGYADEDLHLLMEHHERFDGSGYPNGLKDDDISIAGKIGAVVDIYDAITSDRVYHKGINAPSALKMMFQWADSHINKSVLEFFIKNIGIYPVGSLVMMSTYELAIVGRINNNRPTDPVVIVFMNKNGDSLPIKVIDMSKSAITRQKILGLVNPENIDIPKDVYKYIDNMNSIG